MRITFLIPPPIDGKIPERVSGCAYLLYYVPNIFLLSAAAVLEKEGYKIRYVESTVKKWDRKYFLNFLKEDLSDIYCFYAVNLSQKTDIQALRDIRDIRRDIPVIFFGPAPSDRPAEFVVDTNTYTVRGEPEHTMLELARALETKSSIEGIQSISFKNNNEIVHNTNREPIEDLDVLPFPARHLLEERDIYYNPKLGDRKSVV